MSELPPDEPTATETAADTAADSAADTAAVRRSAVLSGGLGVVALAAAVATYLAAGPPYGQNVAGAVLYLLGLLAALVASVLLWMAWGSPEGRTSPRRKGGLATAAGALVLTCACVVVSLGRVAGGGVQVALMAATAVVLAAAVAVLLPEARRTP